MKLSYTVTLPADRELEFEVCREALNEATPGWTSHVIPDSDEEITSGWELRSDGTNIFHPRLRRIDDGVYETEEDPQK